MSWFKVDDKLHSHPKRHRAGLRAMGLWVLAGSWCGDHLTDGFVPADMLAALGGRPADAKALVDAGLWATCEGGWRFHDWTGQNPTREDVEQQRAEWRQRQAEARTTARRERGGQRMSAVTQESLVSHRGVTRDAVTCHGGCHGPVTPSRPVPSRPVLIRWLSKRQTLLSPRASEQRLTIGGKP